MRRQRRWQQVNVKYVQGSPCARVAGRINNKGFWWKKRGEAEEGERKKKRGGKGILWGSCLYAGLFLSRSGPHSPFALSHSLARIFRLLDPFPVVPRSALPAPSMAIKILSATLLKNYRASPLHPRPRRAPRENLSRSRQLSTNAFLPSSSSRHIASLSLLVCLGLSALRPRRTTVSTIRLLFGVYSLLGSLFPLVACVYPVLSPFVRLVLIHTALVEPSLSLSSLILPIAFVLSFL